MSEKMTRIRLPGSRYGGFMERGEKSADEMVAVLRRHATNLRAEADTIDRATDADFAIDVVRGLLVQHHIRNIQPGRRV
jgi:hypothetical protein